VKAGRNCRHNTLYPKLSQSCHTVTQTHTVSVLAAPVFGTEVQWCLHLPGTSGGAPWRVSGDVARLGGVGWGRMRCCTAHACSKSGIICFLIFLFLQRDRRMAFHIDCKGRHGLVCIDKRPAAYPGWECDACKQQIEDNCVGVLHCAICTVDICPACWTRLLPKIVNASGHPCFWFEPVTQAGQQPSWHSPQSLSSILVCHKPGHDGLKCGDFVWSERYQCGPCGTLTRELRSGTSAAPAAPTLPAGWQEIKDISGRPYYSRVENGRTTVQWERPVAQSTAAPIHGTFMLSLTSGRAFGGL
jgi:hypothetical protein